MENPANGGATPIDWTDLMTPETRELHRRHGKELIPDPVPVLRLGIDTLTFPCFLLEPTLQEVWAVEDLEQRAFAIRVLRIHGETEEARTLILSVKDSFPQGWAAQANLDPPRLVRKVWPWWYVPPWRWRRRLGSELPSLFEAFGTESNSKI